MVSRNVKLVFITNALFLLSSVITSLFSAWALGAEGRGDLTVVTMWAYIAALVANFGLPYAHRFWAARAPARSSEILTVTIVFSLVVGAFTVVASEIIVPRIVGERAPQVIWLLRLFLLNIPVMMLLDMLRGLLEGARLFGWLGASRLSFIASQAIGYFVFWAAGRLTLETALAVIAVAQIIGLSLMFLGIWQKLRPRLRWNFKVLREELNYGLRSYPGVLTEFTVLRLDQIMLTGMASSAIIGLYAVAVAIAEITATLASSVADALMPEVAASESAEKSTILLGKSLRLTLYAHLLVLIPLWLAAPYVLHWIYGAEFADAAGTLRVLLLASIVLSAGLIVISGLNGFGHPGLSTIARLASALTTVAALLWLLPVWGIMGAAAASLIGYSVMLAVALFWLWRKRGINFWESMRPQRQDFSLFKLRKILKLELTQPREAES